jgi:hypothetical protein
MEVGRFSFNWTEKTFLTFTHQRNTPTGKKWYIALKIVYILAKIWKKWPEH